LDPTMVIGQGSWDRSLGQCDVLTLV
jgi:hypothetical protein